MFVSVLTKYENIGFMITCSILKCVIVNVTVSGSDSMCCSILSARTALCMMATMCVCVIVIRLFSRPTCLFSHGDGWNKCDFCLGILVSGIENYCYSVKTCWELNIFLTCAKCQKQFCSPKVDIWWSKFTLSVVAVGWNGKRLWT